MGGVQNDEDKFYAENTSRHRAYPGLVFMEENGWIERERGKRDERRDRDKGNNQMKKVGKKKGEGVFCDAERNFPGRFF